MLSSEKINNSIIIINKPPKLSSHEVSALVKKMLGAKRSGHAGTLDPEVSGVLVIALGKATKLLRFLTAKDKTYVCIVKFRNVMKKEEIEELFKKFTGEITQTPPKESAVRKVPRKRSIHYLKFLEQDRENPRLVLFETNVDAGTYIRTLCDDMGKLCGGARMEELRRIASGNVNESLTVTLQQLSDAIWLAKEKKESAALEKMLHAPEEFLDFPRVVIKQSSLRNIRNGAQIMIPAIKQMASGIRKHDFVCVYDEEGIFFGMGESKIDFKEFESKKQFRGLAVKMLRVHG
jgi:tRNA pseudouridine55 synthase/H/ACA ribonucleoprotein complex subunit 4